MAKLIEMPFGLRTVVGPKNHGGHIPRGKGQPVVKYGNTAMSCAKTAGLVEMPFGIGTLVGPRKHVFGGVHTGATWQIPLIRPCAVVMWPVVKLL